MTDDDIFSPRLASLPAVLAEWLPRQRWYPAKGRTITDLSLDAFSRLAGEPGEPVVVVHLAAETRFADGHEDTYSLPLTLRRDPGDNLEYALVGEVDGLEDAGAGVADAFHPDDLPGHWFVYDGLHDHAGSAAWLQLLRGGADRGRLRFRNDAEIEDHPGLVSSAEQSNSSVIYGHSSILKVFRRVSPGINPDLEITRALAEAGSRHIARPLGWVEGELHGEPATWAVLQEFLQGGSEGWKLATTSVRDLYAEGDLHPDEVGGDFAGESERLGTATAEVHRDLARVLPSRDATPEESRETAAFMRARLDEAVAVVPELAPYGPSLREAYDLVAEARERVPIQRIHGDFHLGQVMRVDSGWVLLDFEGEPARPLAERTALMSPLRDVAGMLRSFDYAARSLLADHPEGPQLAYRADEWAERNREAFCDGYTAASGHDPRAEPTLLRAFELDKAVYEVVYEARHRPSWLSIPLGSIERLVD